MARQARGQWGYSPGTRGKMQSDIIVRGPAQALESLVGAYSICSKQLQL